MKPSGRIRVGRVALLLVAVAPCHRAVADTLTFIDGDRVTGALVKMDAEEIVFRSPRFGEVHTRRSQATVETGVAPPAAGAATAVPRAPTPASSQKSPGDSFSKWWQPWTGRVAMSTEVIQDSSNHTAAMIDARIERRWKNDELRSEFQYEYRKQDDQRQTDDLKVNARWKHRLNDRFFSVYRPSLERNRTAWYRGTFTPYVVLQQEFGVGYTLLDTTNRKLSAGFGEDVIEGWALNSPERIRDHEEAAFLESEFKLPLQTKLTTRAALFHSFRTGQSGLENSIELTRRLTETLSVGLQHQYQHHLPDVRLQNYRRLRLLIGLEF